MSDPLKVSSIIRRLQVYARACADACDDISVTRGGVPVNYNLDFSLLRPVLFSAGQSADNAASARATWRMLDPSAPPGPYRLVISGLTLIEFFDHLEHKASSLRQSRPELYSAVPKRLLSDALATSAELRARLHRFTERGMNAALREPIQELEALLRRGALAGIGDVLNVAAVRQATDEREFEKLFNEQRSRRLPHDRRSLVDSEFHYKIDTGQNCVTRATAKTNGPIAYFVTDTQLNIAQCQVGDTNLARLDLTPLFVRNATADREARRIPDEIQFLDDVALEALTLEERLTPYAGQIFDDLPRQLRIRVARFLEDDIMPLSRTDRRTGATEDLYVDEILEALSRPGRMRTTMEDTIDAAAEDARRLEAEWQELDISYAQKFDLSDDPVVNRLRHRLGVMRENR